MSSVKLAQLLNSVGGIGNIELGLAETEHLMKLRISSGEVPRIAFHGDARIASTVIRTGSSLEPFECRPCLNMALKKGLCTAEY